jgi:hypothetical protein
LPFYTKNEEIECAKRAEIPTYEEKAGRYQDFMENRTALFDSLFESGRKGGFSASGMPLVRAALLSAGGNGAAVEAGAR